MSLETVIKQDITTVKNDIASWLEEIDAEVVGFFKGAMTALQNLGGAAAVKILTDAVNAEQNTGGSAAQKLASAVAVVGNDIVTDAKSVINMGIEVAVQNLPGHGAAATGTVVEPVTDAPASTATAVQTDTATASK